MKKKICIVIVGILIALFSGLNLYHFQKEMIMSDVVMANVEALASGENGLPVTCTSSGNYICPNFGEKVGEIYIGYSLRP